MQSNQQEPLFGYQEELDKETLATFGFSLYQGQPYIMSFRDLLNDMLKAGMEFGALKVLFTHCRKENKTHTNYFRVVVNKWLKRGIKTEQEAKQALQNYKMSKFSTVICKKPKYNCLQDNCKYRTDCPVFTVLDYFDKKINPEVSAATLEDKKMIEARLNSVFNTDHLLKAIDNFSDSKYYKEEGETRLSFLFHSDSFAKDWVNRVIKPQKEAQETKKQAEETTPGENLSKEESIAYLEQIINSNQKGEEK